MGILLDIFPCITFFPAAKGVILGDEIVFSGDICVFVGTILGDEIVPLGVECIFPNMRLFDIFWSASARHVL